MDIWMKASNLSAISQYHMLAQNDQIALTFKLGAIQFLVPRVRSGEHRYFKFQAEWT